MTKHFIFDSRYLPDVAVVEQRVGNTSLFPRTDQLPKLLRALKFEFSTGLPHRLSGLDHRAHDYKKMQLYQAVLMFCTYFNKARQDNIRLHPVVDRDKVARVSIVQHMVEHHKEGALHRFKFYAGEDLFTEIFVNGKRIVFSDHALMRFSQRAQNPLGSDMTNILVSFFGSPAVLMLCNGDPAFVFTNGDTVIAFPVRVSDSEPEYFLATCLAAEQINNLEAIAPPIVYSMHFDQDDRVSTPRNWNVIECQAKLYHAWKCRPVQDTVVPEIPKMCWNEVAHAVIAPIQRGYGPGSRLFFRDNIHGPCMVGLRPGELEPHHDSLAELKRLEPERDWDDIYRQQKAANPTWY